MRGMVICVLLGIAPAAWAAVTVRVIDPSGTRVPDATVLVRDATGSVVARGVTSVAGEAEFADGAVRAEVSAEGFQTQIVPIGDLGEVTVELPIAPVETGVDVEAAVDMAAPVASEPAADGLGRQPPQRSQRASSQARRG